MGFYDDQILPRGIDLVMRGREFRELRAKTLAPLEGRVLEIGFGSGLNLPHYPPGVTEVLALEPSETARRLARRRIAASPCEVTFVGLRGEEIPLETGSVETAVCTWTLCTIPDLPRALGEVRRVLRSGGRLHFLEHGLSADPGVARWQHRLDKLQAFLAGGCHLDRPIDRELQDSGLVIETLERFRMAGPPTHGSMYAGVASTSPPTPIG